VRYLERAAFVNGEFLYNVSTADKAPAVEVRAADVGPDGVRGNDPVRWASRL